MKRFLFWLYSNKKILLFFTLVFAVLFLNAFHENYPDEMDNILGGYFIDNGRLPYTGFFTHHGPLAYYLASILTFFSHQSFVTFRVFSSIFYFIFLFVTFFLIKKSTKKFNFIFSYIILIATSSTYLWMHMFLADPISGYFLIPAYGILFLKIYQNSKLSAHDLLLISVFSSLSLINSPTYSYAVLILIFFSFFYSLFSGNFKINLRQTFKKIFFFVLIFVIPYLIFLAFLFLTKSFNDYYYQALIYNREYYIYNYPRGEFPTVNPLRYAVIIFNNFFNAYQILLSAVKNIDFINPLNITLALSNMALWMLLLIKRKYLLLAFSLLIVIYVNARSNPLNLKASDYQAAVYYMLTIFNASFFLFHIKEEIKKIEDKISNLIMIAISSILFVFWFFSAIFLFGELWRMSYLRYMGKLPLIYDRPQVANMINSIVAKEEYCWIGPFDFEEIFYLDCKIPSRFHIIRPPFAKINPFKEEMISDFTKNKPKVIVYRTKLFGEGTTNPDDSFFLNFLDANYIKLSDYNKGLQFREVSSKNYKFIDDFYFEKKEAENIIPKLIEKSYIIEKN